MSASPNDSPISAPIHPLHNPSQAATVVVPQAPLGNVANQAPGLGAKALLAKKMSKSMNAATVSPTDNMMTPVTQKLNAAKKKHFSKPAKSVSLFPQSQPNNDSEESQSDREASGEDVPSQSHKDPSLAKMDLDDDENPF